MIDLQKAAIIYGEIERIIKDCDSPFLTPSINQTSHKICTLMNNLNLESSLFYKCELNFKSFFTSLNIDGIEVIGYKFNKNRYYSEFYVDTESICNLANPAPFGKGSKTIYDENIRKALEITADRIETKCKPDTYYDRFENVFKSIVPPGKKFNFKLYKMHIYQEGGKFEKHKDTLHASNHYATLIVGIDTKFNGGKLHLYENEKELITCSFNCWGENSIIFLTDVEHEVMPVTSGTRIVLQYDVYLEDENISYKEEKQDEDEDEDCVFNKKNKKYLSAENYIQNLNTNIDNILIEEIYKFIEENPHDEICFLLSRKYPLSFSLDYLKAGDLKLFNILKDKFFIEIGYVVNKIKSDYEGSYYNKDTLKVVNYTNTKKLLEKFNGKEIKKSELSHKNTHVFIAGGDFNNTVSINYVEHTGNESAEGEYTYVSFVLNCKKRSL